jgi:D-amino peptidase
VKILISVDIEGVAGVTHPDQTRAGNGEYERARLLMTEEANAAVAGAFDAGAAGGVGNESQGGYSNMRPDQHDPRAVAIQGKPRTLGMMAGLEAGIDAAVLIGYHAGAHSRGILAHTINSFAFARVALNGRELGEAGLNGALAGEYGAPVVAASGDDVFIAETSDDLAGTHFVEVKRATGCNSGISLSPARARSAIREGVAAALRAPLPTPYRIPGPIRAEIRTQTPALADLFCLWPTLERLSGNDIGFGAPSVEAALRMINSLSAMSSMLR